MITKEITREELKGLEPICEGYKAVKWDNGTQQEFKYASEGESLVGRIYTVGDDTPLSECKWGLHFSRDPAYVFKFYEPLGYNKYFKVRAYNNVIESQDGYKSIAQTLEFCEEYDLMQYLELIEKYDRSNPIVNNSNAVSNNTVVSNSNAVSYSSAVHCSNAIWNSSAINYSDAIRTSFAVNNSDAINYSKAVKCSNAIDYGNAIDCSNAVMGSNVVQYSNAVRNSNTIINSNAIWNSNTIINSNAIWGSNAVINSNAILNSNAVRNSFAISYSYGIYECDTVKYALFCVGITGKRFILFNKQCTALRYAEVYERIEAFNWYPSFANWYDVKGNKEWWAFCFPQFKIIEPSIAWSKMPPEMWEYIKSLPEFDWNVWDKLTKQKKA